VRSGVTGCHTPPAEGAAEGAAAAAAVPSAELGEGHGMQFSLSQSAMLIETILTLSEGQIALAAHLQQSLQQHLQSSMDAHAAAAARSAVDAVRECAAPTVTVRKLKTPRKRNGEQVSEGR